ncbi:MAG: HAD family phosphatase [Bacteroidales bacterium]|jgi:HAD superfamily hydrolase (TIGR01509 family)|nr:HAD family phosphatase [Bacteroidales bacterium]
MIKNIVFDLGGVLVGLNRDACIKAFSNIGFPGFDKILNEYVQGGFFLDYEKGMITTEEFRDIIRGYIEPEIREGITDSQINQAMGSFLDRIPEYKLDLILSLKKSYRIFMLSNTNPIAMDVVRPYFERDGLLLEDYFEKLYLSFEMMLAKPDPRIFKALIFDSGVKSEETLFIDDSPSNIASAADLNFKTLLFSPEQNLYDEIKKVL